VERASVVDEAGVDRAPVVGEAKPFTLLQKAGLGIGIVVLTLSALGGVTFMLVPAVLGVACAIGMLIVLFIRWLLRLRLPGPQRGSHRSAVEVLPA
jgi:hypothetical protein